MLTLENLHDHYTELDSHWIWSGARAGRDNVYGTAYYRGRSVFAHRAVHDLLIGPIPEGFVVDHLCRVPLCVNPEHLEAVTQAENVLRGAKSFRLTGRCRAGHDVTVAGALQVEYDGRTRCRACRRAKDARRVRNRAAA